MAIPSEAVQMAYHRVGGILQAASCSSGASQTRYCFVRDGPELLEICGQIIIYMEAWFGVSSFNAPVVVKLPARSLY